MTSSALLIKGFYYVIIFRENIDLSYLWWWGREASKVLFPCNMSLFDY